MISIGDLSKKLKKEKFGGRDIEGLGGIQLQAYSLAQLAGKYAKDANTPKAREAYSQSLYHLEIMVSNMAKAEGRKFPRLLDAPPDNTSDAATSYDFARLVEAVPPSPFRLTLPQYFDAYANVLNRLGLSEEPVKAMQLSVEITREALLADPQLSQEPLGLRLVDLGYYLQLDERPEDAFAATEEAITIWRRLYKSDPNRHRDQLANLVDGWADDLLLSLDDIPNKEVYDTRREVLALTRESYASDPNYQLPDLLARLSACSSIADRLGYHQDALVLSFESLSLIRAQLNETPNEDWRSRLCGQLILNAGLQATLGHSTSARATIREAMPMSEERYSVAPDDEYRKISHSRDLHAFGELFSKSEQRAELEEGLAAIEKTIEIRRDLLTTALSLAIPEQERTAHRNLENSMAIRSKILDALERASGAVESQREVVDRMRNSTVLSLEDPKRRAALGEALGNLARYAHKAQLREESIQAASEALDIAREIHASDPEVVNVSALERAINLDREMSGAHN